MSFCPQGLGKGVDNGAIFLMIFEIISTSSVQPQTKFGTLFWLNNHGNQKYNLPSHMT